MGFSCCRGVNKKDTLWKIKRAEMDLMGVEKVGWCFPLVSYEQSNHMREYFRYQDHRAEKILFSHQVGNNMVTVCLLCGYSWTIYIDIKNTSIHAILCAIWNTSPKGVCRFPFSAP